MKDPSLDWLFDKDNPPDDKDNPSDVKMTSPSDPKTVRFVSPPSTAQPTHSTTSENDMLMMNKDIMDDLSLMGWTPHNDDPPNDKENSPDDLVMTVCPDGWEFDDDLINNDDSTTTPAPSTITSTSTPSTKS